MIPTNDYEYLKEHIGCKWSVGDFGIHKRKWSKGEPLTIEDINSNREINCCSELPNEITLESDYVDEEEYKNKQNQDHAEDLLKENGVGYFISSHKGKSDYIRFRFKTERKITPKLRLAVIRFMAKRGLEFDENFFSINFVRPVPGRRHWKHSWEIEKVIKIHEGNDLDIDKLGIKEPVQSMRSIEIKSGSMPFMKPLGWALSINIKRLADKRNFIKCPSCFEDFEFNETLGWFKCSCQKGGIKKFMALYLAQENIQ